jgi:hypothetical protein
MGFFFFVRGTARCVLCNIQNAFVGNTVDEVTGDNWESEWESEWQNGSMLEHDDKLHFFVIIIARCHFLQFSIAILFFSSCSDELKFGT